MHWTIIMTENWPQCITTATTIENPDKAFAGLNKGIFVQVWQAAQATEMTRSTIHWNLRRVPFET